MAAENPHPCKNRKDGAPSRLKQLSGRLERKD